MPLVQTVWDVLKYLIHKYQWYQVHTCPYMYLLFVVCATYERLVPWTTVREVGLTWLTPNPEVLGVHVFCWLICLLHAHRGHLTDVTQHSPLLATIYQTIVSQPYKQTN
jgi:hypothetical protein